LDLFAKSTNLCSMFVVNFGGIYSKYSAMGWSRGLKSSRNLLKKLYSFFI
jgi:hypothetical protein